jgi:hypothetical protein
MPRRFSHWTLLLAFAAAGCGWSSGDLPAPTTTSPSAPAGSSTAQAETAGTTATTPPATTPPTTTPSTTTPSTTGDAIDGEPPDLVILSPEDGAVVGNSVARLSGTTEPGARVQAWDRWSAEVDPGGSWTLTLVLDPGTNIARVSATDAAGNTSTAEIVIEYRPPTPATEVVMFTPTVEPTEHRQATCPGPASASDRADTYRCLSGGLIFDPCILTEFGLICGASPITGAAGFIADPDEPLESVEARPGNRPWLIELGDGTLCSLSTGATTVIDGVRVGYPCEDGSFILEDLTRGTVWSGHRITLDASRTAVAIDYGFVHLARVWL